MSVAQVTKRDGRVAEFDKERIVRAVQKAFAAADVDFSTVDFDGLIDAIVGEVERTHPETTPSVESIQDIVERNLVTFGLYEVAKRYILYREKRREERENRKRETVKRAAHGELKVTRQDGSKEPFDRRRLRASIEQASAGLGREISVDLVLDEALGNIYDGVSTRDLDRALVLAASAFIERDPAYNYLAARLYLEMIYREVAGASSGSGELDRRYRSAFSEEIERGIDAGIFDSRLAQFDLDRMARGLRPERDRLFGYIGVHTLYERYFVRIDGQAAELPQGFWMRVAMGLALNEHEREERALEFYELLSTLRFVSSTPTLFHSGLSHPQLSSCYLSTVRDDLTHIFKCFSDNAQLSKWSGGIGNDWSYIRATGAEIHSTKVESQGVVPFLKIANDVTVAINRSGKRRGATCAYLETWHLDIEEFLDLRRNTGDDRRRTHDMNTANWIPDLFMKRVQADAEWTLFSPDETPDLHDLYGKAFERRYEEYERRAEEGTITKFRTVSAVKLWRKMLTRLFETGHPWITFKDPANIRSPQDHVGVVHNSNLCTEITLNNSENETAVCNLGSVNLARHLRSGRIDEELLADTVTTAMRMLDNVVDINYYPTEEARSSNLRHRPVGLGIMGLQDALYQLDIAFESDGALEFSDRIMELVSYHAILGSSRLAAERGCYPSYPGSKWERGIFPIDSLELLEEERGVPIEVPRGGALDWEPVREHVRRHGMRNSNTMAVAPTATISNIAGCFPCIEPIYKNIYVKSNMSGEFTVVNEYLIRDLKEAGLWDGRMREQLKYYDGNLSLIPEISGELKQKYREAFEIDPIHLVKMTARRAKWIDQSQSHNVFMKGTSGNRLSEIYLAAWRMGLKTTYYLRTLAVSQIEKSTLDAKRYGYTQKREYREGITPVAATDVSGASACSILDPDCEACQ